MKLSENLNEVLNEQAGKEIFNQRKYMLLYSYFDALRLTNIAKMFLGQADEEYGHYKKIIEYLNTRLGGRHYPVEIEIPNLQINSPKECGQIFLDAELETTQSLEEIADMIYDSKSYIDVPFIQEMLGYQLIEEDEAEEFMLKINGVSDMVLFDATWE